MGKYSYICRSMQEKKILIIRDPRDRWISSFFYRWYQQSKSQPEEFQKKVRLIQFKEQNPDLLPMFALHSFDLVAQQNMISNQRQMMQSLLEFKAYAEANGWHIFKYEDLIENNFQGLSAYLGLEILDGEVPEQLKRVSRSKAANNWRIWFTDEDVPVFKQIFQEFLSPLGYDAEDWAITKVNRIKPEQGSAYMLALNKMNEEGNSKPPTKFLGWLRK